MSMYRHVYAKHNGKQDKLATVNITIQDCIFAHGLDLYNHAFGASIGGYNSLFTRNLFANNISRNPSIAMNGDFNLVNNVIFNWWNRSVDGGDNTSLYNIINNYYKPGPVTGYNISKEICYRILKPEHGRSKETQDKWGKAYVCGNFVEGYPEVSADNWNGGVQPKGMGDNAKIRSLLKADAPFKYKEPKNVMTAHEAYEYVLANVGATLPKRDAVDEKVIRSVRTGKFDYTKKAKPFTSPYVKRRLPADSYKMGIITHPDQMGGLPEYKGTPRVDSDRDGMPDDWEKAHGLNPNDASDATKLAESGYMNIELYINDLEYFKK